MVSIETPSVALAAERSGSTFRIGSVEAARALRSVDDMTLNSDDGRPVKLSILMAAYNEDPKPFVWTASVESIMAKLDKVKSIYDTLD